MHLRYLVMRLTLDAVPRKTGRHDPCPNFALRPYDF